MFSVRSLWQMFPEYLHQCYQFLRWVACSQLERFRVMRASERTQSSPTAHTHLTHSSATQPVFKLFVSTGYVVTNVWGFSEADGRAIPQWVQPGSSIRNKYLLDNLRFNQPALHLLLKLECFFPCTISEICALRCIDNPSR
jgi:hypothetical protein